MLCDVICSNWHEAFKLQRSMLVVQIATAGPSLRGSHWTRLAGVSLDSPRWALTGLGPPGPHWTRLAGASLD
jgi:hypothetical protein